MKQPESIAIGPRGQVYVSETGEYEKVNDGYISILEAGALRRFATGLDDPHGIKWWREELADPGHGGREDRHGPHAQVVAAGVEAPRPPALATRPDD